MTNDRTRYCVSYTFIYGPLHILFFVVVVNGLSRQHVALPSIWQQPDQRGEEHEEAHTREGKSYPDGNTEKNQ